MVRPSGERLPIHDRLAGPRGDTLVQQFYGQQVLIIRTTVHHAQHVDKLEGTLQPEGQAVTDRSLIAQHPFILLRFYDHYITLDMDYRACGLERMPIGGGTGAARASIVCSRTLTLRPSGQASAPGC